MLVSLKKIYFCMYVYSRSFITFIGSSYLLMFCLSKNWNSLSRIVFRVSAHEIAKQGGWAFWWIGYIISDISKQKNSARKCFVEKANVNVSTFSHTLKDVFGITYIMQVNNITHITTQTSVRKDNHLTWTLYAKNFTKYKEFLRCILTNGSKMKQNSPTGLILFYHFTLIDVLSSYLDQYSLPK